MEWLSTYQFYKEGYLKLTEGLMQNKYICREATVPKLFCLRCQQVYSDWKKLTPLGETYLSFELTFLSDKLIVKVIKVDLHAKMDGKFSKYIPIPYLALLRGVLLKICSICFFTNLNMEIPVYHYISFMQIWI